ncbi:PCSK7 [Cervus elaphus hippelaphus]|uniref:PCSK7 n=1 Tax=Cervus elaphus hippelaphus TaxID=46360 RepID=A0A212DHX2_CEREH|nr:PCSK7 [Cervus elaphus hippelaphus]
MPKGRQRGPHSDAPLGLPAGLWLELAGLFLLLPWVMGLVGAGGLRAQGPGGLSWAVCLDGPEGKGAEESLERRAEALAQATGLMNAGRIGELQGHYLLVQPAGRRQARQAEAVRQRVEAVLAGHEAVRWHAEQRLLKRTKRGVHFNDPKYPQQWHLSPEGSYDLNSNDPDPMPHPDVENGNHHGTRCAGEIAAVPNNSFCAVGVAFGSRIAGTSGPASVHPTVTAVFILCPSVLNSNTTLLPLQHTAESKSLSTPLSGSLTAARSENGLLTVLVSLWAVLHISGLPRPREQFLTPSLPQNNRRSPGRDINVTGVWERNVTGRGVTVVVVDDGVEHTIQDIAPNYAALQHGVIAGRQGFGSIFVVASGNGGQHNDNCNYDGYANSIYTVTIGAVDEEGRMPFYAEECASMLAVTFSGGDKMLRSIVWTSVPYLASYVSPVLKENKAIPLSARPLEVLWNVSRTDLDMSGLKTLEHVAVTVSITHPRRGSLELKLFCPSGMMSLIGAPRSLDSLLESAMSGKYLHDGFTLPCPPGLNIPEEDGYTITPNTLKTLVLIGCFTVFWTIYYMLEVYLSQRNVAFRPICRSGPCHWPQRSQKAKEEGTELESVPLCSSQDPGRAGLESEGAPATSGLHAPDLLDPGDWSLSQSRGALGVPQLLPPDLLQGKEAQMC